MPPNRDARVASFSTLSTPASLKSSRSLSKPTGYGPHRFGLDRSYSTMRKWSATDKSFLMNRRWSGMKCREFAIRIPSTEGRRRLGAPQIRQNLMDRDSVILNRDPVQRCLIEIDGVKCAAGSQQLRKGDGKRSAATTEIAPGLGSPPFNHGSTDEGCCLTDLHISNVL